MPAIVILIFLVVLLVDCFAAPAFTAEGFTVHEKRSLKPHEWIKRSRARPDDTLPVRIGLKQRNLENAEQYIFDVAHPSSPNYGKHWSPEDIADTFAPSRETRDEVTDWLHTSGIHPSRISFSAGRNWVQFDSSVDEAERLLNTEYHLYEHIKSEGYRIACDAYSLPQAIQHHVDFIMPTIHLDGLKPIPNLHPTRMDDSDQQGLTGLSNCSNLITIDCLRALYQFGPGNFSNPTNKLGIVEFADYLYLPDLAQFFENLTSPPIPSDTVPDFISIDGGKTSNLTVALAQEVIESALDFQTAYSIIWPQQTRLYQVGDSVNVDSVGTFNIFLDALDASYCTYEGGDAPYIDPQYPDSQQGGYSGPLQCGGAPISNVYSFSYNQIEAALPVFYQQRQCMEWMKLGLQGVSVLFASGDSGVANRYNAGYENSCLNAELGYVDTNGTKFSPSFPTNCPYITAVGATDLLNGSVFGGERAVASPNANDSKLDYYSGGGFSNVFALPDYQAQAVTGYLTNHTPPYDSSVFNNSGNSRAYPDVSALGLKLATVYLNQTLGGAGTSASTPIVAGLVTLLNEERLNAGKGPIGFLNPVFYSNPDAFNDVTVGGNPGCGTDGFNTAPGWDPVTGLGTPNYPKLKEVFLSLP